MESRSSDELVDECSARHRLRDVACPTNNISAHPASQTSQPPATLWHILTIIYTLNFLDRTVINILIDPIKRDYHLSDTEMGLITGFGFVTHVLDPRRSGRSLGRPRQSPLDSDVADSSSGAG